MLKKYCNSCGQATDYALNAPQFCSHCGKPFSGVLTVKTSPRVKVETVNEAGSDSDEETVEVQVPKIEGLEWEIDKNYQNQGETVASLARGKAEIIERPKEKPLSRKAFLEEFRKEAGTIRNT